MQVSKDPSKGADSEKKPEIEAFIRALNEAWLDGNLDELQAYFARDCVLLPPAGAEPVEGADLIIDSYRHFGEVATINEFAVENIEIFPRSNLAVCHLTFTVDYEIDGQRFCERGLDIYVLSVSGSYFQVVWRAQKTLD